MAEEERPRTTVVVHAPASAFAPGAQSALVRLGYNLVTPFTAARQRGAGALLRPVLRIVDERQLDQVPVEAGTPLPILLLVGRRSAGTRDSRAVGTARRRATVGDLYALLQRALEPRPRAVPRVPDAIPARCTRDGREWTGLIRSLSEKGCLIESGESLEKDLRVELSFPLAGRGMVRLPAQSSYVEGESAGLVFRGATDLSRSAIAEYVSSRLAG